MERISSTEPVGRQLKPMTGRQLQEIDVLGNSSLVAGFSTRNSFHQLATLPQTAALIVSNKVYRQQ